MLLNPFRFGGAPVGSAFYAAMMAEGPLHYFRNAESSGTVMVNEVGADGAYSPGLSMGNAPLYPGGLTSIGGNFSNLVQAATSAGAIPSSLPAMTLVTIARPADLSAYHVIGFNADLGFGARYFQWRSNGTAMEFVKIAGGVTTVSQPGVLTLGASQLLAFEVDSAGNYAMYRNGVPVQTGAIPAGDYGGGGQFSLGWSGGAATNFAGTTCDNAIFDRTIGPAAHAALFAATGL